MSEEKTRLRYTFDFSARLEDAALVARVLEETEPGGNLHSQLADACRELDDARHPKPASEPGKTEVGIGILVKYRMSDAWAREEILAGRQPAMDQELEIKGDLCPPYLLDLDCCEYSKGQVCLDLRSLREVGESVYYIDRLLSDGGVEYCEGKGIATWQYHSGGDRLRFASPPQNLANIETSLASCLITTEMQEKERRERVEAEAAARELIAAEAKARIAKKSAKVAKAEAKAAEAKAEAKAAEAKAEGITAALTAWIDAENGSDHPRNLRSERFPWESAAKAEILEALFSESLCPVAGTPAGMEREHIRVVTTPRPGSLARYSVARKWLTEQAEAHEGLEIGAFKVDLYEYSDDGADYPAEADTFRRYEITCAVDWPEFGISEKVRLDLTDQAAAETE